MKYTAKYFEDNLPLWKRKRDPLTVRYIYRPLSFFTASFCANNGIHANDVSNFSTIIAIMACVFIGIPRHSTGIIGGIIMNFWLLLDCTDGNLARQVKKQDYGEFLDAMSSYNLIAFLFLALGLRAFYLGWLFYIPHEFYLLMGALTSVCGNMMSLLYQKYILVSNELGVEGKLAYDGSNSSKLMRVKTTLDMNLSVGGILPLLILIACMFEICEVIVILWFIYLGSEFIATSVYLVYQAKKHYK